MKFSDYTLTSCLFVLFLSTGCGSGSDKKDAIENFRRKEGEIESILQDYLPYKLLTYVEFNKNGAIDLFIVDREKPNYSGMVQCEFKLFGRSLDSGEIKKALSYANITSDKVRSLKIQLDDVNCISFSRPFCPDEEVVAEIGYQRAGWSKWYYVKLAKNVNIDDYLEKYKRHGHTKLNESWHLTLKSPR